MAYLSTVEVFITIIIILSNSVHSLLFNATESLNDTTTTLSPTALLQFQTRQRWADSAFNYIKSLNCSEVYFTSQRECNHLLNVRKRNVVMYIAQSPHSVEGRFIAMLPDSGLSRAGAHHAVVALDPHPDANFGHLVIVFFIDKTHSQSSCERHHGTFIGNGECMKLALKHRCRNALERRRRHGTDSVSSRILRKMVRRCEVNFIPFVHSENDPEPAIVEGISQGYTQALKCAEDLIEYSLCPSLRPMNETLNLVCNPIRDNSRRCETTHEAVGTSCGMFEVCDKAVLISGGWNRQTSLTRHSENVVNMYHLLRRNGFEQKSIKVFFANGMHGGIQEESGVDSVDTEIFPAAMKTSMRLHIKKICQRPHCVDNLVLYLNSPSKTDGTMLLWDVNKNGEMEADEKYTIDELLEDIAGCGATGVQVIADQSFSGELSKAIRKSPSHSNVFVFASGKEHEYSYLSTFTDHWTRLDHSHICTLDAFQQIKSTMLLSTPDLGMNVPRASDGPTQMTLFGAPCNVDPPFSANELSLWYQGCQNVPTEVWLRTFFATGNSPSLQAAQQQSNRPGFSRGSGRVMQGSQQISDSNSADSVQEIRYNSIPTT